MLIDVQLLAAIHVILPPAPSVFQESSDPGVYTRGSVRRASGFVLTGNSEVMPTDWSFMPFSALRRVTYSRRGV
jgi:hypothetical protein